ncbi:P-type,Magnesium-transporting ATPase [Trichinella spiralis]|uniref:P-type,Magnesium-transporting ATPase n=1 Tax=Trichinella spiralis TaxID=6334 RepID=A0ABR3KQT6_TRISP
MRFTARHDRSIRSSYPTDDRMELVELVVRLRVQFGNSNKSLNDEKSGDVFKLLLSSSFIVFQRFVSARFCDVSNLLVGLKTTVKFELCIVG